MVVESTQREVTSLWYTTSVVISTTWHCEVGHNIFDVNSYFSLYQTAHVNFQDNNAAEFGGAIYVEDVPSRNECFFHIQNNQWLDMETTPLVFEKNTAGMRGSVLYGGLLNKCSFTSNRYTNTLELFNISILQGKW